jgi:hypothetical protein
MSVADGLDGEYRIEFLPIGKYVIEVVAQGFERFRQENVVLAIKVFRDVHFDENRINLQFRAEATNVFNLVSLSAPNLTQSSSGFGKITSGQQMRQIQIGLRLTF